MKVSAHFSSEAVQAGSQHNSALWPAGENVPVDVDSIISENIFQKSESKLQAFSYK